MIFTAPRRHPDMVRKFASKIVTSIAVVLAVAGSASAVFPPPPVTITAFPSGDVDGNSIGSNNAAPGYPAGSVQANAGPGGKSEFYFAPSSLFSSPVTVGDIASISYFTNKPGTGADPDWSFYMYTAKTGSGDTGSFYHSRLTSEPYFSGATVAPNTWHQWSSNDPTNPMHFYDQPRSGTFGVFGDPTLSQLQSGAYLGHNYNGEVISLFSVQTGSGWANGFTGLIDGLVITLNNGAVGTVNFEPAVTAPVPEPASLAVWGAVSALGAAFGWRRRRAS
jgi:hypothetical protein